MLDPRAALAREAVEVSHEATMHKYAYVARAFVIPFPADCPDRASLDKTLKRVLALLRHFENAKIAKPQRNRWKTTTLCGGSIETTVRSTTSSSPPSQVWKT